MLLIHLSGFKNNANIELKKFFGSSFNIKKLNRFLCTLFFQYLRFGVNQNTYKHSLNYFYKLHLK